MDRTPDAHPDDVAALKAALVVEQAKWLELSAELAVARAKASEDAALIAQQKLRIAKLERQVYGQRSERSARLIEQLALDGRAVGLGRAASEVLHMISRHEVIIRGRSERNGKRPLQLREYNLHHSTRCASGLELPWSFP